MFINSEFLSPAESQFQCQRAAARDVRERVGCSSSQTTIRSGQHRYVLIRRARTAAVQRLPARGGNRSVPGSLWAPPGCRRKEGGRFVPANKFSSGGSE